MSEMQKLTALRTKLVARRRALVESMQKTPVEQLTGESIERIQGAIDAVDRAFLDEQLAEEKSAEARSEEARRRVSP